MKKITVSILLFITICCVGILLFENDNSVNALSYQEEDFYVHRLSDEQASNMRYNVSNESDFCIFNCYESVYTADGWEKNNTFNSASEVGEFLSVGYVSYWYGTLHDVSETELDVDYYEVELTVARQIQVKLENIPVGSNYGLRLYRVEKNIFGTVTDEEYIGGSFNSSNADELILTSEIQPAGTYTIKVYTYSWDYLSSSQYKLSIAAKMPNVYVPYRFYDSSSGTYMYNVIRWFRDPSQSEVNYNLLGGEMFPNDVYLLSKYVVQYIVDFASEPEDYFGAGKIFLDFDEPSELESFLNLNPAFKLAIGAVASGVGFALDNITFGTAGLAYTVISLCVGFLNDYLDSQIQQDFIDTIQYAYDNNLGMYIDHMYSEIPTIIGGSLVYLGTFDYDHFGVLQNQYYAYEDLLKNLDYAFYHGLYGRLSLVKQDDLSV